MVRMWHPCSTERATDYVRETLRVIEDAGVPDDLRSVAFEKVLAMLAEKQVNGQDVADELTTGIVRANGQVA